MYAPRSCWIAILPPTLILSSLLYLVDRMHDNAEIVCARDFRTTAESRSYSGQGLLLQHGLAGELLPALDVPDLRRIYLSSNSG